MRTSCVKNGLAVGIILIFIGVAVQPAIAVNPISSDNEEDCSICPRVSKPHLVRLKSLINRVETLDNKLSVLSKHNPKVEEQYQELSDRIRTLKEMNKEVKPDYPYPIICSILGVILISTVIYMNIILSVPDIIPDIVYTILLIPALIIGYPVWGLFLGVCSDWNPKP